MSKKSKRNQKRQITRQITRFSSICSQIVSSVGSDDPDVKLTNDGPIYRVKKGEHIAKWGKWIMYTEKKPVDKKIKPKMRTKLLTVGTIKNNKFTGKKCLIGVPSKGRAYEIPNKK